MDPEYCIDTHLGSGAVRFTLSADRLVVKREKSGQVEEVPLSSITELNLRQDMAGVYTVRIGRLGARTVLIPSRHFLGVGRFEDRGAQYGPFVRRLHEQVAAGHSQARFVAGSSFLYWAGVLLMVMVAVMVGMVAYGVGVLGKPFPPLRLFWMVPLALIVGGGFLSQGRARPYDPRALPEKLLPPTARVTG